MAIEVDSLQESSSLHAAIHASLRKWAIVGVIATVDAMWIWHSSFSFSIASIRGPLILCMIVAPSAWSILIWRRNVGVFVFLDTVILLSVVTASCAVLSYLFMSIGRPLVDQYLSAADHVLGRNWLAYIQWMEEHPRLKRALEIAYLCWGPQWILIPLLLAPSQ